MSTTPVNQHLLNFIDYTFLEKDSIKVKQFLENASQVQAASICVYPQYISQAKAVCPNHRLTTVFNFPSGAESTQIINQELDFIEEADEIDIVFPYQQYLSGMTSEAFVKLENLLQLMPSEKCIKIIVESGQYHNKQALINVCQFLTEQPIHFIKTSTGKTKYGASLQAAETILDTIVCSGTYMGFKASGGIKTVEQANDYLSLTQQYFGKDKVNPSNFRIGASQLVNILLNKF